MCGCCTITWDITNRNISIILLCIILYTFSQYLVATMTNWTRNLLPTNMCLWWLMFWMNGWMKWFKMMMIYNNARILCTDYEQCHWRERTLSVRRIWKMLKRKRKEKLKFAQVSESVLSSSDWLARTHGTIICPKLDWKVCLCIDPRSVLIVLKLSLTVNCVVSYMATFLLSVER